MGDHGHERMAMRPAPGSALEAVKPAFFLPLLVDLLARPSAAAPSIRPHRGSRPSPAEGGLDGCCQRLQVRLCRQVREMVLPLARRAMLADEPRLFAGQVLVAAVADPPGRAVGDAHARCSKAGRQLALRPGPPARFLPVGVRQHGLRRAAELVGDVPLARPTAAGNRADKFDIGRVDLEVACNARRPGEVPCPPSPAEGRADAAAGVPPTRRRSATPEAIGRSISAGTISGLVRKGRRPPGTPTPASRAGSEVHASGSLIAARSRARSHKHRHLGAWERRRDERPAVGVLAERRRMLRGDACRSRALLRQRGVIDDERRVPPARPAAPCSSSRQARSGQPRARGHRARRAGCPSRTRNG